MYVIIDLYIGNKLENLLVFTCVLMLTYIFFNLQYNIRIKLMQYNIGIDIEVLTIYITRLIFVYFFRLCLYKTIAG